MGRQAASVPVDRTFYISNSHPLTGLAGYSDANRHGYFSGIRHGLADKSSYPSVRYRLINSIRQARPGGARDYLIWVRMGGQ